MALSQPAQQKEFFDLLPIADVQLRLHQQQSLHGLRGGEILKAEVAPPYWVGTVNLAPMRKRAAAVVQSHLSELEAPGRTFEAHKAHQIGPANDIQGDLLGGFAPTLAAVQADMNAVRLGEMPEGFTLEAGDFLAFDYVNSGQARRAYHQLSSACVVDEFSASFGHFNSEYARVVPPIREGFMEGVTVDLIKPVFLAILVPGSVNYGTTIGNTTSGISFDFRQVLRA